MTETPAVGMNTICAHCGEAKNAVLMQQHTGSCGMEKNYIPNITVKREKKG